MAQCSLCQWLSIACAREAQPEEGDYSKVETVLTVRARMTVLNPNRRASRAEHELTKLARGDLDVRHLERHPDNEREVSEVQVIG